MKKKGGKTLTYGISREAESIYIDFNGCLDVQSEACGSVLTNLFASVK
jgi:hypothetical protein